MTGNTIYVSVIVPCYQEENHIRKFVEDFYKQNFGELEVELIVADGGSCDGTLTSLEMLCQKYESLKVINNLKRIVSTGLNLAVAASRGAIIIRMDVHTEYSGDYIVACVETLIDSNAQCAGGPWNVFKPEYGIGRAIALAFDSKVGSGNAKSRDVHFSGQVDTVYLGCWWKSYLVGIGLFDEMLVRNQDDELCLRIRKSGGIIFQSAAIVSSYYPRVEYRRLFDQWRQYGFWRPFVIKKHREAGSIRQLIPALFVICCMIALAASLLLSNVFLISALLATYFSSIFAALYKQYPQESSRVYLQSIYAVSLIHFGYGVGFIKGCTYLLFGSQLKKGLKNEISR